MRRGWRKISRSWIFQVFVKLIIWTSIGDWPSLIRQDLELLLAAYALVLKYR